MAPSRECPEHLRYLRVDAFLGSLIGARALATAFESGLIDRLTRDREAAVGALPAALGLEPTGSQLLLGLLRANGVTAEHDGRVALTARFREALEFRDLLEAKLEFALLVTGDLVDGFSTLLSDPQAFMARSRLFRLFSYDRCFERSLENYESTKRWVRLTTALTRHEAGACLAAHDFAGYRSMLDVGGNSGEFALQLCKHHPGLRATVADLPLVCDVGREHVSSHPEADRIGFHPGDARRDPLPAGFDLVSFKSMLHDWPDGDAEAFLSRGAEALEPGGTLLIYERGPVEIGDELPPFSVIPLLLFFRSYRSPDLYTRWLKAAGFRDVRVVALELEMPFFLVTAVKPTAGGKSA